MMVRTMSVTVMVMAVVSVSGIAPAATLFDVEGYEAYPLVSNLDGQLGWSVPRGHVGIKEQVDISEDLPSGPAGKVMLNTSSPAGVN